MSVRTASKKVVMCFPDKIPRGQDKVPFNIPAYVIVELKEALALECNWEYLRTLETIYSYWSTSCGHEFVIEEGTPNSKGMKACPFCEKIIKPLPI